MLGVAVLGAIVLAIVQGSPLVNHSPDKKLESVFPYEFPIVPEFKGVRAQMEPEAYMQTAELVASRGYPIETHEVTTADGYLLDVHRIPYGKKSPSTGDPRPPVFLQHGMQSSSFDWVVNFDAQSLGYYLADQGYDVWMGNFRGNRYSRKHTVYDPDVNDEYWLFSWDQMAEFDLPAMIDYVLGATGYSKLFFVGHSMGTTVFFASMATQVAYNDKIAVMAALGPAAYMTHMTSPPLVFLSPSVFLLQDYYDALGHYEYKPSDESMEQIASTYCSLLLPVYCESLIYTVFGYDPYQLNNTRLPVYFMHSPAGSSTHSSMQYLQEHNSKKFCKFDYRSANNEIYGQLDPPDYDLSKVTAPVALFYGPNDLIVDPKDVDQLYAELGNVVLKFKVDSIWWNHMDFVWGIDAEKYVNSHVVDLFGGYTLSKTH